MNRSSLMIMGISLLMSIQGTAQDLSPQVIERIKKEVAEVFAANIKAGETLDVDGISGGVDDAMRTGFIDNGVYFEAFEELMAGFERNIQGLSHQKMTVSRQKITALSTEYALLTAHGAFEAKVTETGRLLRGKFAWTFIYKKIDSEWKIVHSHMSNPR